MARGRGSSAGKIAAEEQAVLFGAERPAGTKAIDTKTVGANTGDDKVGHRQRCAIDFATAARAQCRTTNCLS